MTADKDCIMRKLALLITSDQKPVLARFFARTIDRLSTQSIIRLLARSTARLFPRSVLYLSDRPARITLFQSL